jgi:hypothetical protein
VEAGATSDAEWDQWGIPSALQAVTAILETARNLNRPVDTLRPQDVRSLG